MKKKKMVTKNKHDKTARKSLLTSSAAKKTGKNGDSKAPSKSALKSTAKPKHKAAGLTAKKNLKAEKRPPKDKKAYTSGKDSVAKAKDLKSGKLQISKKTSVKAARAAASAAKVAAKAAKAAARAAKEEAKTAAKVTAKAAKAAAKAAKTLSKAATKAATKAAGSNEKDLSQSQASRGQLSVTAGTKRPRGRPRKDATDSFLIGKNTDGTGNAARAEGAVGRSGGLPVACVHPSMSSADLLSVFYEEHPELASAKGTLRVPVGVVPAGIVVGGLALVKDDSLVSSEASVKTGTMVNEDLLAKIMAVVGCLGAVVPYDRYLASPSKAPAASNQDQKNLGERESPALTKSSNKLVDMLDREIYRSSAERFVGGSRERIDASKLTPNNKVYIAQWTNRVAMWRFFERYVAPVVKVHDPEIKDFMLYNANVFVTQGGARPAEINYVNPFSHYAHAFSTVMNAWMPCIRKVVKLFVSNTRGGMNLQEDFLSISHMAFLHALEKQAMAMLGNAKLAQGIPFPKRLEFAVRKSIYSELPDLTGPVRVPVESKQRKSMPQEVSLDSWNDEDF